MVLPGSTPEDTSSTPATPPASTAAPPPSPSASTRRRPQPPPRLVTWDSPLTVRSLMPAQGPMGRLYFRPWLLSGPNHDLPARQVRQRRGRTQRIRRVHLGRRRPRDRCVRHGHAVRCPVLDRGGRG